MLKIFLHLLSLLTLGTLFPQIPVDNSYNTEAEYRKQVTNFPDITIRKEDKASPVKEISEIRYKNVSGRSLLLDAFISDQKKLPAVVLIHGGGWKSGSKNMLKPLAQKIAADGYQSFTIDYRLSGEAQYPAGINDVKDAILYLRENARAFNIDASKIAVLGCSSGGQMATLVAQTYPKLVQAIVNLDGILAFHHPQSREGAAAAFWLGGTYEEIPDVWEQASPLKQVTKKSPPVLFINSQFERFHAGRDEMIAKMNAFGIYSEIKKIDNSPHTFWLFNPWFEPTADYITQFLNKTFKK